MASSLIAVTKALRGALVDLEVELYSGPDCVRLAEELARTEKACAAARACLALRAAACGSHRERGFGDAADWLARTSGSTARDAKAAMDTATAAQSCPRTAEAMSRGDLSMDQAEVITKTEKERPGSEDELLDVAKRSSLQTLRNEARKKRQQDVDPDDLHRRQRRAREFRHWRDDLGMVRGAFALTPEVGVAFVTRLEAECDRLRRAAGSEDRESRSAYAADAFAALVAGNGSGKSTSADLVLVCDLNAYRRGHVHPGETCHILDGGPIPVWLARELSRDAFVKVVLHDGVAIHTVAHLGRHIPAELRTALELGPPPDFEGTTCVEAGCGRRRGLEWDHVDPVANRGPTSYDNLRPRCKPHHWEKTERDRKAGLLGNARAGPP